MKHAFAMKKRSVLFTTGNRKRMGRRSVAPSLGDGSVHQCRVVRGWFYKSLVISQRTEGGAGEGAGQTGGHTHVGRPRRALSSRSGSDFTLRFGCSSWLRGKEGQLYTTHDVSRPRTVGRKGIQ